MAGVCFVAEYADCTELISETTVEGTVEEVFRFHTGFANIKKIIPPYPYLKILHAPETLKKDDTFTVGLFFLPLIGIYWESKVTEYEENSRLSDKQISTAPFKFWLHEHSFKQDGKDCIITDRVCYKMHFGFFGKIIDSVFFRHSLRFFFSYRSKRLKKIFGSIR